MRFVRKFLSQFYLYGLWLIIAALFWSFVFSLVTDTTKFKKVTLFTDVYELSDTALAVRLEEDKPAGLKMVKVHSFEYVMLDTDAILNADLYISPGSKLPDYVGGLVTIDDFASQHPEYEYLYYEGSAYGIKMYDAQSGTGAAGEYIEYYAPGAEREDCWLLFGENSVHLGELSEDSKDDAAITLALVLLQLD